MMYKWKLYCYVFIVIMIHTVYAQQQRNPFSPAKSPLKKKLSHVTFNVIGVVQHNNKQGILIQDHKNQHILFPGDLFYDYKVNKITMEYVDFIKEKKVKRITFR